MSGILGRGESWAGRNEGYVFDLRFLLLFQEGVRRRVERKAFRLPTAPLPPRPPSGPFGELPRLGLLHPRYGRLGGERTDSRTAETQTSYPVTPCVGVERGRLRALQDLALLHATSAWGGGERLTDQRIERALPLLSPSSPGGCQTLRLNSLLPYPPLPHPRAHTHTTFICPSFGVRRTVGQKIE